MEVQYIVIAHDFATNKHLGIVAWATSLEQACMVLKAFAFVACSCGSSIVYAVRDASSASIYGPECPVNLLHQWQIP